ncbi:DUF4082 domain-containing protein [Nocardioides sp.]|uniref:DUF4082 domain-containing protein n=1 Tax=Nocardioides sp. TaxID=35761 RepID=UPI002627330E|nr:DUF4082 domain-containing protein [Nocardioides sp.]
MLTGVAAVVAAATIQASPSPAAPDLRPGARAASVVGLFGAGSPGSATLDSDSRPVELGLRFEVLAKGRITGAQVYKLAKGSGKTPTRASLWNAKGKRLTTARIQRRKGAGWVDVSFPRTIAVKPGKTYTVSVFAPKGRYAVTERGLRKQRSNAYLRTVSGSSGVFRYGATSELPTRSYRDSNYWVDVRFSPKGGTQTTPTPTPTPTPVSSGWPNEGNTGVPAGTALTAYNGPMNITQAGAVIDAKTITGDLTISAPNVTVSRSSIVGTVGVGSGGSLTISDSMIDAGNKEGTGLGETDFVAERIHVIGGNRSINCAEDCTVKDSYVHGQFKDESGYYHESGIRMGINSQILHNTIACDAPDVAPEAGCSAPLTGYGDFGPVQNNLIQNNLFKATPAYFCAYGGSSAGKPYSDDARGIRFIDNVFERGTTRKCGRAGPVTDFDTNAPGNEWTGNTYDDGAVARP